MAEKTILLVEDSQMTREAIKQLLEDVYHFKVLACLDGASAIALLTAKKPHIDGAVLDIMMRGHGGSVRDYLKSLPEYKGIPIIYHTSLTEEQIDSRILVDACYMEKGKDSIRKVGDKLWEILK